VSSSSDYRPEGRADQDKVPDSEAVSEDQIEIELVSVSGAPAPGIDFVLTLPDGSERVGRSDRDGMVRFSGLTQRGECDLELPNVPRRED
jgi:hypothetical protein